MLEKLLKELGERGYEVMWRYETMTNSIRIRMEKKIGKEWCYEERIVGFDELYYGSGSQSMFEFNMDRILREMFRRLRNRLPI